MIRFPGIDDGREVGFVAGLVTLAALVTASAVTDAQLIGVFGVSAIVAGMLTSATRTAAVGVLALVCAMFAGVWHGTVGSLDWFVRCLMCVLLSVVAVQSAALRARRESRLHRMTVIAETAQRAVLRAMPTGIGSVGLAARYVSATAEALVGGDLYEVAATPYGVRVIVGDVRGKGLEAVQTAASVLGAFRASAFTEPDVARLARAIDETLRWLVDDEEFVTAIVGEFDGYRVRLANCGHHPPLLIDGDGVVTVDTGEPTVPLGMGSDPIVSDHSWPAGARMLFYTDGLVEARDRRGEFFPLDEHAPDLGEGSVEAALDRLIDQLLDFSGHRTNDDLALVLAESELS